MGRCSKKGRTKMKQKKSDNGKRDKKQMGAQTT
jgi:hypothetical protein